MPSLKERMAALQAANDAPVPKAVAAPKVKKLGGNATSFKPTVTTPPKTSSSSGGGGGSSLPKPKKLAINAAVFAPTNVTPVKKSPNKPIDLHAPTQPKFGKVGTAVVTPEASRNKDAPKDWKYLYELAVQYDTYKLQEAEEKKNPPIVAVEEEEEKGAVKKDIKASLGALLGDNYTAKGDWLTDDFITKHLVSDTKFPKTLTFRFTDPKLFKRFDKTDETNRKIIIEKFVDALVSHPKAKDITNIHMSNCLLPDMFLEVLATKIVSQANKNLLGKVQVLNLESNILGEQGMIALSKIIECDKVWRYLQILRLENQKDALSSEGEHALAAAILNSPSLAVVSLSVRGGLERQQINNTVATNIDLIRQARREHASAEGTLKARKRNEMEVYFDKVAANDTSQGDTIDLVGNLKFLSLNSTEKTKAGTAFGTNAQIKTVKMVKLGLDDNFAKALGKSLETNTTIEKLLLDSNSFTGDGIKAILDGLAKNSNTKLVEIQVRHQSKTMSSTDEEALPPLLEPNHTLLKIGIDVRNPLAKSQLERKANANRETQRKLRAAAKKG